MNKPTNPLSSLLATLFPAFIVLLQFTTVLLSATLLQAETRYIKPSSEVVVRRGQGTEYKIIAIVKDGTAVEFVEEEETFAKVQLANGKEGWMLKRFLSSEPPLNEVVASLRGEKENMQQRQLETDQQLKTISANLGRTERERKSVTSERNQIKASYTKLQQEAANVVQIRDNLQKTTEENRILTQKLALLEQENDSLKKNSTLKWFLAGGGVLLLGMIIGQIGGSRKKKSSLR
jgi:SH3 domain protein